MNAALARISEEPAYRRAPEEKRGRLLEAALRLFTAQGFEKTSTAAIAREAGVSEGILFHHFGSKLGLFEDLAKEYAHECAAFLMPGDPGTASLAWVARAAFDFSDRDPARYRLFVERAPDADGRGATSARQSIVSVIQTHVEAGMREGSARRGDAVVMAELQFAVLRGAYFAWRRSGDPARREAYIEEAIHSMKAMLAP